MPMGGSHAPDLCRRCRARGAARGAAGAPKDRGGRHLGRVPTARGRAQLMHFPDGCSPAPHAFSSLAADSGADGSSPALAPTTALARM